MVKRVSIDIGSCIGIEEGHKKLFEALNDDLDIAHVAFREASHMLDTAGTILWDVIRAKYPELSDFDLKYNRRTNELIVVGRRWEEK